MAKACEFPLLAVERGAPLFHRPASAHSAMQRGAFIALAGFVLVAVLANPDRYPNNTLLETLYASASIQTGNLYKVVLTVACDPK